MENASFISTEDGDDLIVSFAIPLDEDGDVKSLILLRTPKYEFILDKSEQGIHVSYDDFPDSENELLKEVAIQGDIVTITTNYRTYSVGIKDVDDIEIEECKRVLKKMNYDGRFEIKIV